MADGSGAMAFAALWLALAVDRLFAEPPAAAHPVVWMGRYLGWAARLVAPPAGSAPDLRFKPFMAGTLAWCAGAAIVLIASIAIEHLAQRLPVWLGWVLIGLALKPLLAWRMLRDEVLAVEVALGVSLDAGRAQLARLVSRDVGALSESEVRESAIESLAENLNDSVVAPVFWFLLLGLPGAALYRFANTADAMWGYRGERNGRVWEWAGKWTARADDVLSWLPARFTALLLSCSIPLRGRAGVGASVCARTLRQEAARTPSPNSGWPMAAMALSLGVRLAKPGVYTLNAAGREPTPHDTQRAAALGERAVFALALSAGVAMALASFALP